MPYEVGISSGILAAARPEEMPLYIGLARKAYYAITQGVKFVQVDLESISELEQEGLKEEIEKVKEFGIKFGIHSETVAFGVEAAELDSAIERDYIFGHERIARILELAGEIGSIYVLVHSSESYPLRVLERVTQPAVLVDFFGNPLDEFIRRYPKLEEWLIGGKVEEVAEKIFSVFEEKRKEIKPEDIEAEVKTPNFLWREILAGASLPEFFPRWIVDRITAEELRDPERRKYEEWSPEERASFDLRLKDHIRNLVGELLERFLRLIRSRVLHYGPERFAYWIVAKYLEMEEPEWWNKFVSLTVKYFATVDGKTVEEWLKEEGIEEYSINDEKFRMLERLWVPAVSAKYIWGHFMPEKNWKGILRVKPDLKEILRKWKMIMVFESPMARRGIEEWLRLPNPLQFYHLCREIGEDITGIALDFEHMMSIRLMPEVVIDLLPEDGGRLVRVIHAGWPSPLAPAHLPLLLGSDEQFKYYKWLYKLRKKGLGVKKYYLIYERGAPHVRESIVTLRRIAEFVEKEVDPEKLPPEFFGVEPTGFASPERQREIIRAHAFEPLKGLLVVPEEEWTFLGRAARERAKVEEWKKEELK